MSGKTTIGKRVAEKLGWNFIDTDRLIEQVRGSPCRAIFLAEGEKAFRELEKEQIASLQGVSKSVIAVGGGSLNDPDNVRNLQANGKLVYLQAPLNRLLERMQEIPAYLDRRDPEKSFAELAKRRLPLYEKAAHAIIDTGCLSESEVVAAILKELSYGK